MLTRQQIVAGQYRRVRRPCAAIEEAARVWGAAAAIEDGVAVIAATRLPPGLGATVALVRKGSPMP